MGQATIFNGQKIKTLKDTLTLNGKSDIISSMDDPTASAVDAPIGSLLINQTSGKLYRKLDPGSSVNWEEVGAGVGGINYILNPSAEVNTTGWATYADAAGTAPVDGTGGSPNVTWTRSTTSPLRGVADFNFAKDAANRQGQGVSYDFTIDEADKAKVLSVTFDYEVLSGTYADGDLTVYLIADPAGTPVVIQPAGYTVLSATSGTTMRQRATFQTQATGTSYRLCFHVASTSASAYTLAIDNVVVGPQQTVQGAAITDWQSYTPTGSWLTNATYTGKWRRIGDSLEVDATVTLSGAPTATSLTVTIPTGITIDTNKMTAGSPVVCLGLARIQDATGSGRILGDVNYSSSTSVGILYLVAGANNFDTLNATAPITFATGDKINLTFRVPISGWSSNTVMSQDTDTRVVAAHTYLNTTQLVGSGGNAIVGSVANTWGTSTSYGYFDTHSGINFSTGQYLVSVSGIYEITGYLATNSAAVASNAVFLNLHKNGTSISRLIGMDTSSLQYSGSTVIPLNAGDLIDIRLSNGSGSAVTIYGAAADAGSTHWSIRRLSGPATIAASETVAMLYTGAPPTGSIGPSLYTVTMGTKVTDSHNAYSSGEYIIPVSGRYSISASVAVAGVRAVGNLTTCSIIIDNVETYVNYHEAEAAFTGTPAIQTSITSIPLLAGQKVKLGVFTQASTPSYSSSANSNYLSIVRVGN